MELYIESQHLHFKPPRLFATFTLWYTVCTGSSRQTLVWGAPCWYATPSKLTLSPVEWGIIYSSTQQATHHECYWIQIHLQSVRMSIIRVMMLGSSSILHISNSHEYRGINGEALQLYAVYKKSCVFTSIHARIRIRYCKSHACV